MDRKMRLDVAFITHWPLLILIVALLTLVQSACAQTAGTGALSGSVVDVRGGTVAGAKVVVTRMATGEVRSVITDDRGGFLISTLLPQLYKVEISKDGFKTLSIPDVRVSVAETTALNLRLEVGQISERVVVEGYAQQLQTESSALGRVTTGEQVRTLPLVTRNYTQIISLNPGVASDVTDAGALGRGAMGNGGAPIVANGGSWNDNNVQMNGAAINDLQSSGTFSGGVAIPNPDTIQEFKVQTGQYDALTVATRARTSNWSRKVAAMPFMEHCGNFFVTTT